MANGVTLEFPDGWFDEETRDGFLVTRETKRLWGVMLDMVVQIDRICNKHGITYFLCGGSLLGAIRHKGFIPWDDDFDVMMKRNDYNRFCEVAPKELDFPFFFQTEKTDPGYLIRHGKIRNSLTTGMFKSHKGKGFGFNQGVFVDVFPLDNLPDNLDVRKAYYDKLYDLWGKVYRISAYVNRGLLPGGAWRNLQTAATGKCLKWLGAGDFFNERFERLAGMYKDDATEDCCLFSGHLIGHHVLKDTHLWKTKDYLSFTTARFEFLDLPIPVNYESQLVKLYGDWRKFVIGKNSHGELIVDLDHPYGIYA